jgi:hypothetical protein
MYKRVSLWLPLSNRKCMLRDGLFACNFVECLWCLETSFPCSNRQPRVIVIVNSDNIISEKRESTFELQIQELVGDNQLRIDLLKQHTTPMLQQSHV